MMKKITILSLLNFLFLITFTGRSQDSEHLIAFWTFDNQTADDFSGNNYHGTLMNNYSFIPGVKAKGKALHIEGDGVNSANGGHVILPNIPFESFKEFTISLWVKEYYISNFMGEAFISFGSHTEGWIGIMNSVKQPNYGNTTRYLHYSVGLASELNNPADLDYYFPNSVGSWNLYTIVYKNNHVSCYVNANLVCEADQKVQTKLKMGAIGRHWWSNGSTTSTRLTADIDEVKIFDKALSDIEIKKEFDPVKEPATIKVWFPYINSKVGENLQIPLYAELNDSNWIGKYELNIDWTAKKQVLYYTGTDGKAEFDYLGGDTLRLRCKDSIQLNFGETVIKNFDVKTLLSKYDLTELHIDKISLENSSGKLHISQIDGELHLEPVCKGTLLLVALNQGSALLNNSKLEFFGKGGMEYKISVYDYLGKCHLVENFTMANSKADIDLKGLSNGYYNVKISDSEGKLALTKSICLY